MPKLSFSVDAALLKELGERLVGQPHIALAELIKNSYDADASKGVVTVTDRKISILDDGDGMSLDDFRRFWMRVGTPHKQRIDKTHKGRRPTGSKGIGRLAVQFLGSRLSLRTTATDQTSKQLVAKVDWSAATRAGELTQATVEYEISSRQEGYADNSKHGTEITIRGLNQEWTEQDLTKLAQQIWQLQPPFNEANGAGFRVELEHEDPTIEEAFALQLRRNLDIWSAKLRGRLLPMRREDKNGKRSIRLSLEFQGEDVEVHTYQVPDCDLHSLKFEIRIFSLFKRQRYGIGVEEARNYLREYGGVHIYDGGFHLPYYGPDTDWLRTEIDHSHRLSRSKLLPEELQIELGLNNLPTNSRLYGTVEVDTSLAVC